MNWMPLPFSLPHAGPARLQLPWWSGGGLLGLLTSHKHVHT